MIDTIDILFEEINKKLKKEFSSLNLEKKDLEKALWIIFDICSENEFSFNILRDEYQKVKVEIFDKSTNKNKGLVFNLQDEDISHNQFTKELNELKKLKIIPVIGPDGVGKTTLLTTTIDIKNENIYYKRFKKIIRRSFLYNALYPLLKAKAKKITTIKPQKDQIDDINYKVVITCAKLYYPYLKYLCLLKKKIVFVDRFFNDYLLKDISFKEKTTTLREDYKKIIAALPKVLWYIHLDANADIILNRKDELTQDDILKYKELNFKIYLEKPSILYSYINTGLDIDRCKEILKQNAITLEIFTEDMNCLK